MLREEVTGVVEGVLDRTRTGKKFTAAVIAGLGAVGSSSAKAAGMAVAGVNTVLAAKTAVGASNFLGLGLLPLIGDWILLRTFRARADASRTESVPQFHGSDRFERHSIHNLDVRGNPFCSALPIIHRGNLGGLFGGRIPGVALAADLFHTPEGWLALKWRLRALQHRCGATPTNISAHI